MNDHPYRGRPIRSKGASKGDEIFTLQNTGMINITKLERFMHARPELFKFCTSPLTGDIVDNLRASRDLDPARLAAMTPADIEDSFAVGIHVGDREEGTEVEIIDGNHYVVRAWEMGYRTFKLAMVPPRLIPQFTVHLEVQLGKKWVRVPTDDVLRVTEGMYGGRDGNVRDREGRVLAHLPTMKTDPSPFYSTQPAVSLKLP